MNQHLHKYRMSSLCCALKVSKSGYYAWLKRPKKANQIDLATAQAFERHKSRAGAPCLTLDVAHTLGRTISQRTVGRSLRKQGLKCKLKKSALQNRQTLLGTGFDGCLEYWNPPESKIDVLKT